jgi:membrane protease YdiL (CAAX protease family)
MSPSAIDHLLAAILVLVAPWLAVIDYRRMIRSLEAGQKGARVRAYRQSILVQWSFAALLVGFWLGSGRALPALGLGLADGRGFWIGLAATLGVCAFLVSQVVTVRRHPEARRAVLEQIGTLRPLLPHTAAEARWFTALSVTAGVCEEIAYRGFLMAYFAALGLIPAILLSTLAFGLAHAYMGTAPAVRAGLIGLVVAALYWWTASLWSPMLLHAVADVTSGMMARLSLDTES